MHFIGVLKVTHRPENQHSRIAQCRAVFALKEGNEIFYSYRHYKSKEEATENLEKQKTEDKEIIREEDIKDNNRKTIGKKVVFYAEKLGIAEIYKNYYLLWTNKSSFYWIRSKSISGIEEMEKECKF